MTFNFECLHIAFLQFVFTYGFLKFPGNIRYDLLSTKHLLPPNQFANFEDKYLRLLIGETFRFTGECKYFKLHKFQVYM